MRISTNLIFYSVVLLAANMIKGAQCDCTDEYCPPGCCQCCDDGCILGRLTNGSCDTCSSASECTAVTCDTNYFDTNTDATDGCEATCPDVANGSCDTCSSASECTAVTCATNYFDDDADFNTGCEATCPDVANGSCDTCDRRGCITVICDTNYFDTNTDVFDGCEATCPGVANGSCDTCSSASECTAVTCDTNYFDTNTDATDGCEATWKTIRGCCRERVENSKRLLNHHGTASTETFFGSLDSVLISCTAACATDAVCTAVEVTKKNRAAAKCEFHVERMNAGDRSTKSCKKATCMVKTGFVAPETAAPSSASPSPTEWNERRGCCREHAGKKKYVNHVGTNIILAERTYAAATKACKDECDGRSTCTAVETRRNQRKKVYMCELHTAYGINASSRASKSCKKALCAVKV